MSVEYLATHLNNCGSVEKLGFIFTLQNGLPLTYVTAQRIIDRTVKNSGMQKKVAPHDLRRARATHLIKQNFQESVSRNPFGAT
jgi:site-specific recombinase XerD